jgi:hypothetical protein
MTLHVTWNWIEFKLQNWIQIYWMEWKRNLMQISGKNIENMIMNMVLKGHRFGKTPFYSS